MSSTETQHKGAVLPTFHATSSPSSLGGQNTDPVSDGSPDRDLLFTSTRPPLLIALTDYRLLNMLVILVFGTVKMVLALMGHSAMPTALDWVLGVLFAIT